MISPGSVTLALVPPLAVILESASISESVRFCFVLPKDYHFLLNPNSHRFFFANHRPAVTDGRKTTADKGMSSTSATSRL